MSQATPVDPSVQAPASSEGASLLHGNRATPNNTTRNIVLGVVAIAAVSTGVYFIAKPNVSFVAPDASVGSGSVPVPSTSSLSSSTTVPSTTVVGTATTAVPSTSLAPATTANNVVTDPEAMEPALTFLAVGDWGSTTGKEWGVPGSCCRLYQGQVDKNQPRYLVDFYAQMYVANLMAQSATQLKPSRILGHGDNFYWNGVGAYDVGYRFSETFEKMYSDPALQGIKWLNVAGNHDIGGSAFICGEQDNQFRECTSTEEMIKYLRARFDLQAQYKSPNQDRWLMKDHYYVERVAKNGVTVDVFNLDTNHADAHGARQVCCQCYGYSYKLGLNNKDCESATIGMPQCMGGNVEMFNACMDEIEAWATDSYVQASRDIKASNADFKIINTHYSPHHHMNPMRMQKWYDLTKDTGVHLWMNGHTHGFGHDISTWGTHFIENGGGGGIRTDSDSGTDNGFVKTNWVAGGTPYGFMELSFSKDWLKVQFVTFDKQWKFGGLDLKATVTGGIQRGHCWYIPGGNITGAPGAECKSSVNYAIGAPLR